MFLFLLDGYISKRGNSGSFKRDYLSRNLLFPRPHRLLQVKVLTAGVFLILPPCALELRGFTEGRGSLGGSLGAVALLSGSGTVLEFHTISCFKNELYRFKKMSLETGDFG